MWVLGLLPFLFFVANCLVLIAKPRLSLPLRDAMITSALFTSTWLVLGTELLSLLHTISFWPLLAWWAVPSVPMVLLSRDVHIPLALSPSTDRLLLGIVGASTVILVSTLIAAAITSPSNWDALTYHLPRQVYWMQQKHLGIFPTNDIRMLTMPPFAEYAGLNLMILSGGDHWTGLIQWFALGLTALTASCIAREFQLNARMQAAAALLVLTIPIAALESMTPKNDVVAGFFLCAMALKAWDISKGVGLLWLHSLLFALAAGLLVLTKSTGLVFGAPIVVWAAVMLFRRYPVRSAFCRACAITAIALLTNMGHWTRMHQEFRSPFGPPVTEWGASLVNSVHTPGALASNLLRNFAMHLATENRGVNAALLRIVEQLHNLIRLDVNDQHTTFAASAPFAIKGAFTDEDRAKVPFHALLGAATLGRIFSRALRKREWVTGSFALAPFFGFLLFCYVLTWQEWHSRLHIPVFCLLAPIIVRALADRSSKFLIAVLGVTFLLAIYSVLCNETKPLIGRSNIFTHGRSRSRIIPSEARNSLLLVQKLCRERRPELIGIYAEGGCEYTLLKALLNSQTTPAFFKMNAYFARNLRPRMITADMIMGWYGTPPQENRAFYTNFTALCESGPVWIFARNESPENSGKAAR